jgi:hypothetical protein
MTSETSRALKQRAATRNSKFYLAGDHPIYVEYDSSALLTKAMYLCAPHQGWSQSD